MAKKTKNTLKAKPHSSEKKKDEVQAAKSCPSCKMTTKPCACGAPSKIGPFIKALEKVLDEEMNAFILTDEELIMLVNDLLSEEEGISDATFERWKANDIQDERCQVFRGLYKKALAKQKQNLFKKLNDLDVNSWQRYAWQLERKFAEWNLKKVSDTTHRNGPSVEEFMANAVDDDDWDD